MSARRSWLAIFILGLVIATVCGLALWSFVHEDQRATIGEEIMYDDFGFRVRSVRSTGEIGRLAAGAGETLLVVRLEVENHARRVDYDLSGHVPHVEDVEGRSFEPDHEATAALEALTGAPKAPKAIHAGGLWASDVVFRVPSTATGLQLRIAWREPFPGFDELVYGDRTIALGK